LLNTSQNVWIVVGHGVVECSDFPRTYDIVKTPFDQSFPYIQFAHCSLTPSQPLTPLQKFEGDTSLTRNDYYLANGDDYSFNGTLFANMQSTCAGNFNRDNLALYRYQRYQQSKADNGNFYFGPKALLLIGAATFLYELFPSLGPAGTPDLATISYFFGAQSNGNGGFTFNNHEQIPPDWYNRQAPLTTAEVAAEAAVLYLEHPTLFGGNAGKGNFDLLNFGADFKNGQFNATTQSVLCLLYQIATENVPSSLTGVVELPLNVLSWAVGKLNPVRVDRSFPRYLEMPE